MPHSRVFRQPSFAIGLLPPLPVATNSHTLPLVRLSRASHPTTSLAVERSCGVTFKLLYGPANSARAPAGHVADIDTALKMGIGHGTRRLGRRGGRAATRFSTSP